MAEDFERLAVRWADAPHARSEYPSLIAAITAFPELYATNRDALPQNDADRAFALLARAIQILDRTAILAETDEAAARLTEEAARYVDEALKLDLACYDAVRVQRYLARPARDEMVEFLSSRVDEVCAGCWETARKNGVVPAQDRLSQSVYLRPYLRWLYDLANEQLSCGRYRRSLEVCLRLLDLDAADMVGARLVAAYDYAKLEDEEGLERLTARFPGDENAWFLMARCFIAYKARRLDEAAAVLHKVVRTFPRAGCTLFYQDELPPGVFGHLEFAPGTEDELYIAVSEGAVVFDENCGDYMSPLSDWICRDPEVVAAHEAEEAALPPDQGAASAQAPAARPARPAASASDEAVPEAPAGFGDISSVDELLAALDSPSDSGAPERPAGPDGRPTDFDDPTVQGC